MLIPLILMGSVLVAAASWLVLRRQRKLYATKARKLQLNLVQSQFLYLGVLRREMANTFLSTVSLVDADEQAENYEEFVRHMSADAFSSELARIYTAYGDISNYDCIATAHHAHYTESPVAGTGQAATREAYLAIVKHMAILCRLQNDSGSSRAIDTGTNTFLLRRSRASQTHYKRRITDTNVVFLSR